jgi:hypothetical protein
MRVACMIIALTLSGCTTLENKCRATCDDCSAVELECSFSGKKSDGPMGVGP